MFSNNKEISVRQLRRMLIIEIFSTTSLLMPALLTRQAGYDGILALLVGSIFAYLYVQVFIKILDKTDLDYVEIAIKNLGKFGIVVFAGVYIIRYTIRCSFALELFCELIISNLLPGYTVWAIALPLLLLSGYLGLRGLEVRARTMEFLFFIIFIPLLLVMVLAIPQLDFKQAIPVFTESPAVLAKTGYGVLLSFSALEFILFSAPNVNNNDNGKLKRGIHIVFLTVVCLHVIIFITTVGMFGVTASKQSLWPALSIMQTVKLPGGFVERLDILLIAFWIFSMFGIISGYLFYGIDMVRKITDKSWHPFYILIFLALVFACVWYFGPLETSFAQFSYYMAFIDFPIAVATPIILLAIRKARRRA